MPSTIQMQRPVSHRHQLRLKQPYPAEATSILPDSQAQAQLNRSLALMLTASGFDGATNEAIESFRSMTESYMIRLCSLVNWSMRRCRRTEPTAWDFEQALSLADLSTAKLQHEFELRIPPSLALPKIPPPPPAPPALDLKLPFLNATDESAQQPRQQFSLPFCPALPSQHTYKSTSSYSIRETNPQTLREKAAEQGRLGEEAIRALVVAGNSKPAAESGAQRKPLREREREKSYEALLNKAKSGDVEKEVLGASELEIDYGSDGEETGMCSQYAADVPAHSAAAIGAVVNSDSRYMRKPKRAGTTAVASIQMATQPEDVTMTDAM
ncbi:MAG: hypothetical protein M1814_005667 [Vezdaea aestivalis]|nr:MAG: hypothetical protein M1814_005667 [Vezdaea aestivalis]